MAPKKTVQNCKYPRRTRIVSDGCCLILAGQQVSGADSGGRCSLKSTQGQAIYEKLSCEGFSDHQIERALSYLKERATFEAALDWLCLNLRGNELPSKFSSGTSELNEGSVSIISTAREDWVPSADSSVAEVKDERIPKVSVVPKGRSDSESLRTVERVQADWIRQYMEQQMKMKVGNLVYIMMVP